MNNRTTISNLCPMCGKHEIISFREMTSTIIKDEYVEFEQTVCHCSEIKNEDEAYFVTGRMLDENLLNARNAYRAKMGLLTSYEIIAFHQEYGLSQADLSNLMGWNEITILNYETKVIADEASDKALRQIINNPLEMLKSLRENKSRFTDEKFAEIEKKIMTKIMSKDIETTQEKFDIWLENNIDELSKVAPLNPTLSKDDEWRNPEYDVYDKIVSHK